MRRCHLASGVVAPLRHRCSNSSDGSGGSSKSRTMTAVICCNIVSDHPAHSQLVHIVLYSQTSTVSRVKGY
jgi:hypothetical protein